VFLLVCVGYTLLGVLRAVIATGFIQTLIILLGVTWVAWLVMDRIGTAELHTAVL
jgi:Na+/proline symporter